MSDRDRGEPPSIEEPNALLAFRTGVYPDEVLRSATQEQIRELLARDRAELDRRRINVPRANTETTYLDLEIRINQLQNALNQTESAEFWRAVMYGCSPGAAESGVLHPRIPNAEALFREWQRGRTREIERRRQTIVQANLTIPGRAYRLIELTKDLLLEEVEERIRIYAGVSSSVLNLEMLSPPNLARLRSQIAHEVGLGFHVCKESVEKLFAAAGFTGPAPNYRRYIFAAFRVLEVADVKVEVLRTDYCARNAEAVSVSTSTDASARSSKGVPATEEQRTRRRQILAAYRRQKKIARADALARFLGISLRAIQGMVTGDRTRYSPDKLTVFLEKIGCRPEDWK